MNVVVMGGGIMGVTTAYFLAKEGHQVTILERNEGVGQEASFQNGALLAPGHSQAWAAPGAVMTLIKSLFQDDPALRFRFSVDPRFWRWGLRFLANCNAADYRANTLRILRCMMTGVEVLRDLQAETDVGYEGNEEGILYIFRSEHSFQKNAGSWTLLREHGFELEEVDRDKCAEIEPALEPNKHKVGGGFFAPKDGAGDAYVFTCNMAKMCEALGVRFEHGVTVSGLKASGDRIESVVTDRGEFTADSYLLALGIYSPHVARKVGLDLPIWPVKGYTVSVPIDGYNGTPRVGIIEEDNLVAFAHLGSHLRVGGKAEFAGYDTGYRDADFRGVFRVARDLFPDGGDYANPKYWACPRPVTPGGPPILGRSRHRNLYLNVGHGAAGWTMSCATSKAVADIMLGRTPEMDMEGLTLDGR